METRTAEINEMEIRKLADTELIITIVKMLNSMRKDVVTMKKYQSEIKNDIALVKNTFERISSKGN